MNVAIIPAKGHSTRVPKKNLRSFWGKPIIVYTIETALACGLFDFVYVSTDDEEVVEIALEAGAIVLMRGPELCVDAVGPLDVARYHLEEGTLGNPEFVCVLYATAPMMTTEALQHGWSAVNLPPIQYAFSIGVEPLHDAAQFFWCNSRALRNRVPEFDVWTTMIPVPPETDIDINFLHDWQRAERMYLRLHPETEHQHRFELMPHETAEMVHFRCPCGESLPT